ncbi:choice-of-anchor M domain-containing protein [Streptomyces sp. NPDC059786]|uniref:choice-of-anchor M domain-containing protein n=1 Tax=Streptomyces sp. NPDC059786 TaxID=3346946 RepID=UPI003658D934
MTLPLGRVARRARSALSLLSSGGVLALALAAPANAATGPADGRELVGAGQHVDAVYPVVEDGRLDVRSLTDGGEADPDDLALHIPDTKTSRIELPEEYAFLGTPGDDAWISPQTQDKSVVWPGWSFEGIEPGVLKGTVAMDFEGFAYAGEAKSPTFAVTQPGGFGDKKVSQLIVPGSAFTSVSGEVGAHTHANWIFTDQGTYDIDFNVHVTLADGKALEDSATVRFIVGPVPDRQDAPVAQKVRHYSEGTDGLLLTPNKVDAEYFVGQTINLTAASDAAEEDSRYRWYAKKKGESAFTEDPEQDTAVYSTKPDRALDGTQVYAELLKDGKAAQKSEPTTVHVRALDPTTRLTVTPDRKTYSEGDTARFTSEQNPKTDDEHYHWYLKRQGESSYEWIEESRLADQELPVTAGLDGAQVVARLFDADHAVLAESAPVTLSVEADTDTDAGKAGAASPVSVGIDQDAERYAAGAKATFTAQVRNAGKDYSVSWSVRQNSENPFTEIADVHGRTLEQTVPADWNGAQVLASVKNADGKVVAEGTVPVLKVTAAGKSGVRKTAAESESGSSSSASAVPWAAAAVVPVVLVALVGWWLVRRRKNGTADADGPR